MYLSMISTVDKILCSLDPNPGLVTFRGHGPWKYLAAQRFAKCNEYYNIKSQGTIET